MTDPLAGHRARLDAIDDRILDLLRQRHELAADVVAAKIDNGLPIFVPAREQAKVAAFRSAADARGIDPDWAEDLLRMIMSASRARQSTAEFPRSTPEPKTILVVGGRGRLGSLGHPETLLHGRRTARADHAPRRALELYARPTRR